jgi:prevent-host-death family protein
LIDEASRTHEPILVIQRSRPAAYLISAEAYEAMEQDLKDLRRQVFWQGVDEAWAEHERGESTVYDDVEALISDLGLEEPFAERSPVRGHPSDLAPTPRRSVRRRPTRATPRAV